MSRPSSTLLLLRRRSGDTRPFNLRALITFWGLQFLWMELHILFLTAVFTSSDRISVFLLYAFLFCSYLVNAFDNLSPLYLRPSYAREL
jgi:hypothetical protein